MLVETRMFHLILGHTRDEFPHYSVVVLKFVVTIYALSAVGTRDHWTLGRLVYGKEGIDNSPAANDRM